MADPYQAPFVPDPAYAEKWDNPEMAAFKQEEAEERIAFAKSHTREEWLAAMEEAMIEARDEPITLAWKPESKSPSQKCSSR